MNQAEFTIARSAVLAGKDPPAELLADCRRSVGLLVRTAGLPAHYSPYGVWSDEAIEEVYADWVAVRLVGRGQLLAILQRAPILPVFRRMVETSVRQHLIDRLKPSQAANLYERVTRLLGGTRFAATGAGRGRLWRLIDGPEHSFDGDDRQLLAVAWSLGEFQVLHYDAGARKLSPLLDADELDRFVTGVLGAGAMTAATIVRALRLRFGLDESERPSELDDSAGISGGLDPQRAPVVSELAVALLAELTARQVEVLIGIAHEESGRELATRLGCSTGTISHERSRIADILSRFGSDAPEVLKYVLDSPFQGNT
jgi:hypothetical protein